MNDSNLDQILDMVQSVPTLPEVAQELSRLAGDPNASAQDMAQVAEADSGLAAQILRVVNSSFFGFSRQISTIPQSIVVLGTHGVRNIALSITVSKLRPQIENQLTYFNIDEFWRHSLAVAIGARQLSRSLLICDPEEAFLAGLLHDIGKLVMIECCPDRYQEIIADAAESNIPLHLLEESRLGFTHADVGFALCERWKIPDSVAYNVQHHHHWSCDTPITSEQNQLLFMVNTANNLAKVAGIGSSGNPRVTPFCMQKTFSHRSLSESLQMTLEILPSEVAHTEHLFNISSERNYENKAESEHLCAGIVIQNPDFFKILSLLLLSQGVLPVTQQERLPENSEMIAVITDIDLTQDSLPAGWSHNILKYNAFSKLESTQSTSGNSFEIDVEQLRLWLLEQLPDSSTKELVT